MPHTIPDISDFKALAARGANLLPMYRRLLSDQLTPVLAYRRLVRPDDRMAPSFLLESVVGGDRVGRYSFMAAQPVAQVIAYGHDVNYINSTHPDRSRKFRSDDPLREMDRITEGTKLARVKGLPDFTGGWVGYAGYDTVRYLEGEKLPSPPPDDRHLPDLHMGLYRDVVAFDHVQKTVLVITHVHAGEHKSLDDAYAAGSKKLDELVARIETVPASVRGDGLELPVGEVNLDSPPPKLPVSNMGEGGYQKAVLKAKEYIAAGDVFQVVPSQRFELRTTADPFDLYRSLRVVNPSPYMFYIQIEGGMLIGSSPEILCRVHDGEVTNRPLAGTRRRGKDEAEDAVLEKELLTDPKDRAEHIMLVDLGRNDVGRVARPGSIELPHVMVVERYSHVMHISSTVTGKMREGATCWDALRVALPVGTVSGAPKVRAMQIIDELEPTRRGPYAGAVGYVDFAGNMDMAIALRTMVVRRDDSADQKVGAWIVHLQAGGGIVADSEPDAEHQETVNKAAALAKAVDLAERAFGSR
ncbi:MAG: anthranilate synthase component I [Planctomycetes bacterium]|nr:anthranilate synthase component I [Planctomycetota bacterium]